MEKAGRAAGKAFQDDSFHNYMARKIDLQRQQFGVELPPDPRYFDTEKEKQKNKTENSNDTKPIPTVSTKKDTTADCSKPFSPIILSPKHKKRKQENHSSSPKGVTFAENVKQGDQTVMLSTSNKEHPNSKERKKKRGGMSLILQRLQKRHGKGRSKKSRKRQRPTEERIEKSANHDDGSFCKHQNNNVNATSIQNNDQVEQNQLQQSCVETKDSLDATAHKQQLQQQQQQQEQQLVSITNAVSSPTSAAIADIDSDDDPEVDAILGISTKSSPAEQTSRSSLAQTNLLHKPSPQTLRERPDLFFLGVVVMVNGYTNPDTETIQRLLHKHGGDLEKYETTRITHIVAEHLSQAKAAIYKRMQKPTPVVHPKWITDSVAAKKLLPHGAYLIEEVKNKGVASVKAFFTTEAITDPKADAFVDAKCNQTQANTQTQVHALRVASEEKETNERHIDNAQSTSGISSRTTSAPAKQCEQLPTLSISFSSATTGRTDDKYINGRIRTKGTDPNFLESFFHNSRLSFIGSYKQRTHDSPQTGKQSPIHEGPKKRFIFHCDMDCFFASVVLRSYPQYQNKPVVISHFGLARDEKESPRCQDAPGKPKMKDVSYQPKKDSSSECATCNYEARKYGIQKGMFLGRAKELCPQLIVLPYDFDGYEEVSEQVTTILQRIVTKYNGKLEQVSCDESYLELWFPADDVMNDPYRCAGEVANNLRIEILRTTKCTATVGVGDNKFIAKIATDRAKPNGSFVVRNCKELLRKLKLRDLHGIGYRTDQKLVDKGVVTVQDVWDLGESGESELSRILGQGLGKKIFALCNGQDDRPVEAAERKTIGAQCYYGVRFDGPYGVDYMIEGLAKEVARRMQAVGVRGRRVTLKIKQRKAGAKPPEKFLGHGSCHNLSKSLKVSCGFTRDWEAISEAGKVLCQELNVPKDDIRGMGITMSDLDILRSEETTRDEIGNQSILKFFKSDTDQKTVLTKHSTRSDNKGADRINRNRDNTPMIADDDNDTDNDTTEAKMSSINPSFSQIDPAILQQLPRDIQNELRIARKSEDNPMKDETGSTMDGAEDVQKDNAGDLSQNSVDSDTQQRADDGYGHLQQDSVASSSAKSEQSICDVALPPMSQIHLSQVDALPSPMKRQINAKIANYNSVSEVDQEHARESPKGRASSNAASSSNKVSSRLRQTNLKRMLKLAAFKAEQAISNSFSVKELECLPLEMQLQVANNDTCLLGSLTPAGNTKRGRTSLTSRKSSNSGGPALSKGRAQTQRNKASPSTGARRSLQLTVDTEDDKIINNGSVALEEATTPSDFFQDTVEPLSLFMDENPPSNIDALNQVMDYLCLCVKEKRLYDAVLLLRNIRNRRDQWSSEFAYGHLCSSVDSECNDVEGYRLDWEGLGLK